jgi:hypothetical protein
VRDRLAEGERHPAAHGEQERGKNPVGGGEAEPLGVDEPGKWMRPGAGCVDDDHQRDGQAAEDVEAEEACGLVGDGRHHG